jgi:hypothetical protein
MTERELEAPGVDEASHAIAAQLKDAKWLTFGLFRNVRPMSALHPKADNG